MKKIILTFGVAALLCVTSCEKKETTKAEPSTTENTAGKDSTATDSSAEAPKTVNGVEVPKFSNADTQKFADEYAAFMGEMTEATKSGDAAKIQELSAKSQEWSTKQAALASKMTPEDVKLWTDFAMKLNQAQMPK